ncbi:MAG TPA: serine hydroxymethyltransferase, partial [bacterium]|nr:serine hydroxymethyltransferase [bacterium]
LCADIAHIAGIIVAGLHPSPIKYAEFVTGTTHKTLRGPRGGFILCRSKFASQVDRSVFPGIQGGPLVHVIAGKAVAFKEAMSKNFISYQKKVILNSRYIADELAKRNYRIITGGTDNHLVLVDLRNKNITGIAAQQILGDAGITVNRNAIPFDPLPPNIASGIRIGTPAITTRGMGKDEINKILDFIDEALSYQSNQSQLKLLRKRVKMFASQFPLHEN